MVDAIHKNGQVVLVTICEENSPGGRWHFYGFVINHVWGVIFT